MTKLCGICDEKPSKYCCPQCEIFYCSLPCYQSEKHTECSETFYKKCVQEELTSKYAEPESKAKMVEILKRMHDEEKEYDDMIEDLSEELDSDDNEESVLHKRLKNINLEDADEVWNVLTDDERNEFKALVQANEIGAILPHWEPWWTYHEEDRILDLDDANKKYGEMLEKCPPLVDVPTLKSLTSVKPSDAISNNITNVLASYAFVMRYMNGECDSNEFVSYILDVCANLATNANFESNITALKSVEQRCFQSSIIQTDQVGIETMNKDVLMILQGPNHKNRFHYCKAALSHLHTLLKGVKIDKDLTEKAKTNGEFFRNFCENTRECLARLDKGHVKRCTKKIEYYLSYLSSVEGKT